MWVGVVAVIGAAAAMEFAVPAGADTPPPPPSNFVSGSLGAGDWIAYTLSNTNPSVFKRNPTLWGPVSLSRQGTFQPGVLGSEPGPGGQGWPSSWSSGGVTLERASQFCPIGASSCDYYVTGGNGNTFWFGAQGPPSAGGPHDFGVCNQCTLRLPPPPVLKANLAPPAGGPLPSSGSFTFDASGSSDGMPGALTYEWALIPANGSPFTQTGPQSTFTPPASVFSQNGQYCVTLVVRSSDGSHDSPPQACFAVIVTPPTTTAPPNHPPAGGGGGGGGPLATPPANNPGPPAAPVNFGKPLPANFAVPVPGAVQQVTVIWLWKPDWFQPTQSGIGKAVKTAGRPKAVARASVSVSQNARHASPSAAPWLAGLGVFGIFGAGWLAFRRRSLRSSLLD